MLPLNVQQPRSLAQTAFSGHVRECGRRGLLSALASQYGPVLRDDVMDLETKFAPMEELRQKANARAKPVPAYVPRDDTLVVRRKSSKHGRNDRSDPRTLPLERSSAS